MSNPLWASPRIPGEVFKLGLEIGPVTVAQYIVRTGCWPSDRVQLPRNQALGVATIRHVRRSLRVVSAALCYAHPGPRFLCFKCGPVLSCACKINRSRVSNAIIARYTATYGNPSSRMRISVVTLRLLSGVHENQRIII
jgi:hypothetical protein